MHPSIYMDANATTPLLPEVVAAMSPFWTEHFGNPSSVHQPGQRARAALDHAREEVAALLHCRASEIVFTSGGTESNNLALFGAFSSLLEASAPAPGERPQLITSAIEHEAVLRAAEALSLRGDVEVVVLPCTSSGRITPGALASALTPRTRLVSIMLCNNETGVLQPVRELAELTHTVGALFHTDAIQAVGKLPLTVGDLGCDLLTLSGHKFYGPKGTGALFIRRGTTLGALHFGGPQEAQRRAGTENVAGLVGLGRAADLAQSWLHTNGPADLTSLRDQLETSLVNALPNVTINGSGEERSPNTTSVTFHGVIAEDLMIALDLQGLAVSAGSACQSGAVEPSHVLSAMGLSEPSARSTLRFSLLRHSTPDEVGRAADLTIGSVRRLRSLTGGGTHPLWP